MLGDSGYSERSGEIYLPYVGHLAEQAVLLRDGAVMAIGHVGGAAFELEEPEIRNAVMSHQLPALDLNKWLNELDEPYRPIHLTGWRSKWPYRM